MKKLSFILITIAFLTSCRQTPIETTVEKVYEVDSLALAMGVDTLLLEKGRHVAMEGAVNFRDLGGIQTQDGKTVKWNKIYRADKLSELTAKDFETLNEIGIKTAIDFRTNGEVEKEPDTLPTTVTYTHLPIGEDNWARGDFMESIKDMTADTMEAFMVKLYSDIPLKWTGQYKKYFETLVDTSSTPLVFHCTAGKDRTGIGSALLLYTLGVDMETIKKEYELSNYYRHNANEQFAKMFAQYGISADVANSLMGVKGSYLETVFKEIANQHGSLDDYLKNQLGVTDEVKSTLRALYLK